LEKDSEPIKATGLPAKLICLLHRKVFFLENIIRIRLYLNHVFCSQTAAKHMNPFCEIIIKHHQDSALV